MESRWQPGPNENVIKDRTETHGHERFHIMEQVIDRMPTMLSSTR